LKWVRNLEKKLPEHSSTDIPEASHGKENRYIQKNKHQ
jgi:hypothetical protein